MARFSERDADNYGNNNQSSFFQLKNDKDTARVRFMYNNMEDVYGVAVHDVEVNGKKRYVNCIREYNDPKNACPFCAANRTQVAKVFVPLYDVDEQAVKIWERGKKYLGNLSSICSRYASADTPLVSHIFEIERSGRPKDPATTYREFDIKHDDTRLEDLPEVPEVIGGIVLDKTAEEMQYYLDHGEFPEEGGRKEEPQEEFPRRRTPSRRDVQQSDEDKF